MPLAQDVSPMRMLFFASAWMVLGLGPSLSIAADTLPGWGDSRMPVKPGLLLWLDASRQPAARSANQRPPLFDNAHFDVWYDASGNGRNLIQRTQAAQPRFVPAGDLAVVRFDGKDDCLELSGLRLAPEALTVFIVAAPRTNSGMFRGLIAGNETGKNDYITGFNLDLTGNASLAMDRINVEGRGFGGAVDLLESSFPFGEFHTYEVAMQKQPGAVRLWVDGTAAGKRDRMAGKISLDDLVLGARIYSNSAEPPYLSGFFDGDLAEVLLFDRSLSDVERKSLAEYFRTKYSDLERRLPTTADRGQPLKSVKDPPAVQMFVPGFAVRELPLELKNINNLRYRHDGKLVALAYDGNIHLLTDTDGDGLEDHSELFWENSGQIQAPIGMALTHPGYPLGDGVFVACKGKVSLLLDSAKTGKADREIVVAQGWKALPHGVDALGVALDRDGSLYFGLGTTDYTNAYLVGGDTKSGYRLEDERGTVMRVSPDFKSREIVATGIRFPVGMAFNRRGDLFVTDQEGATWLPNGNPYDELLQIQKGRHYGFPPRHPKHLPGVIDEPSVFDYSPQHQSTCGMAFNDPLENGRIFGPKAWEGDALVTGYSRGKLYRTKLVPTEAGYVAQNQLLACLNRLAADVCVSPKGALLVAAHSGEPDWGSGPQGMGKLYQINYRGTEIPQPALAWPAGPREVRVAFDRPLDLAKLKDVSTRTTIEFGRFVAPGDRFESLRPGYAVVGMQMGSPRFPLPVHSVQVSPDRRTLTILTDPAVEAAQYALTLPNIARPPDAAAGELPQVPVVDLGYDLSGVTAQWHSNDGKLTTVTWLPHLDLEVARALTKSSSEHDSLWKSTQTAGRLTLRTRLDLSNLLRPVVQPGSQIDYTWPGEQASLVFRASSPIQVKAAGKIDPVAGATAGTAWRVTPGADLREPLSVEIEMPTSNSVPKLTATWSTQEDPRERAFPLRRMLLPWASTSRKAGESFVRAEVPELKGGNWHRGKKVFFGDKAICSRCHTVGGQGGRIGPDLSNLIHRDYHSVLKDVRQPNAAINPDHVAFVVELKDGRALTGLVRRDEERVIVGDKDGREHVVDAAEIEAMTPASVSIMPEGIDKSITPDELRDLLTFLLTVPLEPAPREIPGTYPIRTRPEVEAALAGSSPEPSTDRRLHVVLCSGPKDHGPGEHDYPLWQRRWLKLFDFAENVFVTEANGWPTDEQFADAATIVLYSNNPGWSAERAKQLDAYLKRGGGLVYIHYAVDGHTAVGELAERIGLAWKGGASKFRHGPLELHFPNARHPIARGFDGVKFEDESYWDLVGDLKRIDLVATGEEEGAQRPLMWTRSAGKGKIFVSIPGHYTWTFDDPLFRLLILRGIAWSAGESVDRFNPLVYPGAQLKASE